MASQQQVDDLYAALAEKETELAEATTWRDEAIANKDAELTQLREDLAWLTEQWQRHRKALNVIAWTQYYNVAFAQRLAQDELAIGVKVANDRAAATVKATHAAGALGRTPTE